MVYTYCLFFCVIDDGVFAEAVSDGVGVVLGVWAGGCDGGTAVDCDGLHVRSILVGGVGIGTGCGGAVVFFLCVGGRGGGWRNCCGSYFRCC